MPEDKPKQIGLFHLPGMGIRYAMAYWKWVRAGKPLRDADYIKHLFSICENCPSGMFDRQGPDEGQCLECTCFLKRAGTKLNKLAWPTEGCDLDHWHADVEEPEEDDEE